MSRLQALVSLRNSIFKSSIKYDTTGTTFSKHLYAHDLTTYYPPDISMLALSAQDSSLKSLGLRDVWMDGKLDREIMLRRRNKNVRVSVLLGMQVKPAAGTGGKKKRKK